LTAVNAGHSPERRVGSTGGGFAMTRVVLVALFAFLVAASTAFAQSRTPPPITHPIDGYLVTPQENNCLECHDKPKDIGKKLPKGANVPAPVSHYGGKVEGKASIVAGYYNCTSCHAKR
jgi:nitrate reductase cytochrome c-type subunit